jgi:nucleoside-diphosphate-sugar epimerase
MLAVVTGAAGFIGSTLTDRLLAEGHRVVGVDAFTDYYDPEQKRRNLDSALAHPSFRLVAEDLAQLDLEGILASTDVVFHQAAQPGVRLSWDAFERYERDNVLVTQRLLEALRHHPGPRLVYASSSSVYGTATTYPVDVGRLPAPESPYGVTKLAGEHLCSLYARTWGVPTVSLRYFTVFGPRQRPDMAIHRLVRAALDGTSFPLLGDGSQVRDFTFVEDVVDANILAATADIAPGLVVNVAGGSARALRDVIDEVECLTGRTIDLESHPPAPGDVPRTGADPGPALEAIEWQPRTPFVTGLKRQVEWHRTTTRP